MNGRRHWAGGIVLAVLVAAAVVAFLVLRPSDRPAASAPAAPPFAAEDATAISEGLAAGDLARLSEAVVLPSDQPLDPAAVGALAALDVRVDPGSFRADPDGDTGTAQAQVTAPDGTVSSWTVSLVHIDSQWRLVASTLMG